MSFSSRLLTFLGLSIAVFGCKQQIDCPVGSVIIDGMCMTVPDTQDCTSDDQCDTENGVGVCSMGACAFSCDLGFDNCDSNFTNGCEALDAPEQCGACGMVCTSDAPGTVATCESNSCGAQCDEGFTDCDDNLSNGCEASPTSIDNCGTCGTTCSGADNADPVCEAGSCTLACEAGWGDCNGDASDGCEARLDTPEQCGACDTACTTGQYCTDAGACRETTLAWDEYLPDYIDRHEIALSEAGVVVAGDLRSAANFRDGTTLASETDARGFIVEYAADGVVSWITQLPKDAGNRSTRFQGMDIKDDGTIVGMLESDGAYPATGVVPTERNLVIQTLGSNGSFESASYLGEWEPAFMFTDTYARDNLVTVLFNGLPAQIDPSIDDEFVWSIFDHIEINGDAYRSMDIHRDEVWTVGTFGTPPTSYVLGASYTTGIVSMERAFSNLRLNQIALQVVGDGSNKLWIAGSSESSVIHDELTFDFQCFVALLDSSTLEVEWVQGSESQDCSVSDLQSDENGVMYAAILADSSPLTWGNETLPEGLNVVRFKNDGGFRFVHTEAVEFRTKLRIAGDRIYVSGPFEGTATTLDEGQQDGGYLLMAIDQ